MLLLSSTTMNSPTGPGDSRQKISTGLIKVTLVLQVMYQESRLILLKAITLATTLAITLALNTINVCLTSMDFLEKFVPQWLHWKVM